MTNLLASSSLPEDAYTLAAQHGLGTPQAQYQRPLSRRSLIEGASIVLAGAAISILGMTLLSSGSFWRSTSFYFEVMTFFALGQMLRNLILHRLRVLICTEGLIWRRGEKQRVARWGEVESVSYGNAALEPVCTIRKSGGTVLRCLLGQSQTKALSEAVSRATEPYLLPRALETYRSGTPVHFGKLITIGQDGIRARRKLLPWNHYYGYFIEENALTISQQDGEFLGEFWIDVPLPKIANLTVLTGLLDALQPSQVQIAP